jgi:hypothetical protein
MIVNRAQGSNGPGLVYVPLMAFRVFWDLAFASLRMLEAVDFEGWREDVVEAVEYRERL